MKEHFVIFLQCLKGFQMNQADFVMGKQVSECYDDIMTVISKIISSSLPCVEIEG